MKNYRSSIPKEAHERIISTFSKSRRKHKADYVLNGKVVGVRYFHETGQLESEYALKDGLMHGIAFRSDVPGELLSAEPYAHGLPHGVAKQWSADGTLVGTYRMTRGTGVDLWWAEHGESGESYLSEARYLRDGKLHGFEWWLNEDQRSVWSECHFQNSQKHGIERSWNQKGRLRRGHPKYWINDRCVTKRQYLRESGNDGSLPPYREIDNRPARDFPPEVKVIPRRAATLGVQARSRH